MKLLFYMSILISTLLIGCTNNYSEQTETKKIDSLALQNPNLKIFEWNESLCSYSGYFDSTRVTRNQLSNSLDLVEFSTRFSIETDPFARTVDEFETLSVDSLDREFEKKIKDLETADFINETYWINLKNQKMDELKAVWYYKKMVMLSYLNPDTLKYFNYPSNSKKYAEAIINGGQDLLIVWKELVETMAKNNADPNRIIRTYEEQLLSSEKYKYAHLQVISFGFWNSANETIKRADDSNFHDEFIKNFSNVAEECDEP